MWGCPWQQHPRHSPTAWQRGNQNYLLGFRCSLGGKTAPTGTASRSTGQVLSTCLRLLPQVSCTNANFTALGLRVHVGEMINACLSWTLQSGIMKTVLWLRVPWINRDYISLLLLTVLITIHFCSPHRYWRLRCRLSIMRARSQDPTRTESPFTSRGGCPGALGRGSQTSSLGQQSQLALWPSSKALLGGRMCAG